MVENERPWEFKSFPLPVSVKRFYKQMPDAHHPIQVVSRLSGLSLHAIRIWEQRHRAVEPQRTPTNRQIYSQSRLERLNWRPELT